MVALVGASREDLHFMEKGAMRRTVITFGPAFLGTRVLAILEGSKSYAHFGVSMSLFEAKIWVSKKQVPGARFCYWIISCGSRCGTKQGSISPEGAYRGIVFL